MSQLSWVLYLGMFFSAGVLSLVMTPIVKRWAISLGAVDEPNHRKVHKGLMPRMGGLAIYISIIFTIGWAVGLNFIELSDTVVGLIAGGTVIVALGMLDDIKGITPREKILGQVVAALAVIGSDVIIQQIHVPFVEMPVELGLWSYPITFLWLIGVTNAMNLIDGLDGLAAGVAGIATLALTAVALMVGNMQVLLIAVVLLGAILGFLWFNGYPAQIFMGDTGSMLLGFILAVVSVMELKQVAVMSFLIPLLILGVPLADTMYAIWRRKRSRVSVMMADKKHLHHCLLDAGYSHRQTVFIIYGVSSVFAIIAVLMTIVNLWVTLLLFVFAVGVFHVFVHALGMFGEINHPWMKFLRNKIKVK